MKKVLIIANLLYSSPRIPGLAKYLPEFRWEPAILASCPSKLTYKFRVIETPYRGDIFWLWRKVFKLLGFNTGKSILNQVKEKIGISSKKSFVDYIFNLYMTLFAYPDEEKRWEKSALKIANKLLEKEKFDAIISTSSPVTAHIIADKLKIRYKIPWIADLRDLWTQNHNYPYPWWRKVFERRLELKTLLLADVLVTVSSIWTERLKNLHKRDTVYTIVNGFDSGEVDEPPVELIPKFIITYTGQIYDGKQDPLKFLVALKDLILDQTVNPDDVEVRFYGPEKFWLQKKIEEYKLSERVKQYGMVPRKDSLKKQRESQILLLLNWEDEEEKGIYPGKIFEYLAARRPILATGGFGSDVVDDLLKETKAGFYASDIKKIKQHLKDSYNEYKQKGKVEYHGDKEAIDKYSQLEMAKKFSDVLNQIT